MAQFYTAAGAAIGGMMRGDVDLDTQTIVLIAIDSADYTPNYATHATLSDVPSGARVATSASLTPTLNGTTIDVPDFSWTAVTGDQFEQVLVCVRSAAGDANHRLLFMIEDADETELAMTPNGNDIDVTINASGLVTL